MVDDETPGLSPDDILEAERTGKLTGMAGNNPLPEDADPSAIEEPDRGDDDEL